MIELTEKEFISLRDFLLSNYGIDLTKKRILIQGRLTSVLQKKGFTTFTQYIDEVMNDKSGAEVQLMLNRLTTNLTFFMRENEHFEFVKKIGLPKLESLCKRGPLRVWSAGCSSGEEPYTLAMIMLDYFGRATAKQKVVILASDISQDVLSKAQQAIYPASGMSDVPKDWITKYFDKINTEEYQVKDFVRELVTFRTFNLMAPFKFSKPFEIVFCRNVMIYFEKTMKQNLVKQFYDWTAPGGYFFISHSENIGRQDLPFSLVQPSVFRRE